MNALGFLALAVIISAVGFVVLYLRSRQPTSLESGIDAFQREMHALSPEDVPESRKPRDSDPGPGGQRR